MRDAMFKRSRTAPVPAGASIWQERRHARTRVAHPFADNVRSCGCVDWGWSAAGCAPIAAQAVAAGGKRMQTHKPG